MQNHLTVDLGSRSYPIDFGQKLISTLGQRLRSLALRGQTVVITNETIAPLFLAQVETSLRDAGYPILPILLPDGEIYKNNNTLQQIYDRLLEHRMERSTILIALGGGVIGDMTGYAAATFLRGVDFVQIPTTLLAQVDSSVGGKTGINHPLGKNLIGAFYQPRLVVCDLDSLATLPRREFVAGMAEVVKYGLIHDRDFFYYIRDHLEAINRLTPEPLLTVLHTCCAIKGRIVSADERESGQRALLNFGHTFGHAIETLTGYDQYLHGEAVGMGIVMAADLSRRLGWLGQEEWLDITQIIRRVGLPDKIPPLSIDAVLEAFSRDKKVHGGRPRFVLLQGIGRAVVTADVPESLLIEVIRDHASG
ncbi:MAG: 3-dehydroquinate synthase [Magnetococcales bacterium]|nr:3-dehydroquinate synthase [Magnetococcales bacterium]